MALLTQKEAVKKLESFQNFRVLYIFIPDTLEVYQICPTDTGDNLLPEDREAGYNDYLYCRKQSYTGEWDGFGEMTDEDVSMLYFNNETEDWNKNIANAVIPFLKEQFITDKDDMVIDFIPLFGHS